MSHTPFAIHVLQVGGRRVKTTLASKMGAWRQLATARWPGWGCSGACLMDAHYPAPPCTRMRTHTHTHVHTHIRPTLATLVIIFRTYLC